MTNSLPINPQRMHYEDVREADSCSACGSHDAYAECSARTGAPLPADDQSDRQVTQGQPGETAAIISGSDSRTTTADDDRHAKIAALHATLSEEVETLMTSDGWAAMLAAAARFRHYSLNNTLLLMVQTHRRGLPTDSRVAGFNTWKSLGRMVRKGEKGLAIFAPCTYRPKAEEGSENEAAPSAGKAVVRGFRVAYVFAESQTDGDEIPDIRPTLLPGDAPEGLWANLAELVSAEGFTLERGDCGQANGYTNPKRKIVRVRDDVSDAQAVKTLAHELAHVLLHCDPTYNYGECRGAAEVEAESISYIVSAASGLDTTIYAAPYVAGWAGGDLKRVKNAADRVVTAAGLILARLESRVSVAA